MAKSKIQMQTPEVFRSVYINVDASNIDSFATSGIFNCYVSGGAPYGGRSMLIVANHNSSPEVEQTLITTQGIAYRHYENGAWKAWKKVAFS